MAKKTASRPVQVSVNQANSVSNEQAYQKHNKFAGGRTKLVQTDTNEVGFSIQALRAEIIQLKERVAKLENPDGNPTGGGDTAHDDTAGQTA